MRKKKKNIDEEQIDRVIESLRICSQSSSCENCMFKSMRDEYEQEFETLGFSCGADRFPCRSDLMDAASELLCDLFPD